MDIESMLEFISRETPGHAKEIWSAIDLLSNTIENTKCAIDGFIGKLSSNREYDKASEYMKMSQNMAELLDMINQYTYTKESILQEDDTNNISEDDEEYGENTNILNNDKVNYENYRVNEEVEYNIYTDFTYKKPAAFSLNGKKYLARKWQDVFSLTCEILVGIDLAKFVSFATDASMQGRKRAYFSNKRDDIRKPKKVKGTNVFIETNLSANNIRNIIVSMLEKYNIPKKQYKIYLSKDLTSLHETKEKQIEKVDDKESDSEILKKENKTVYSNNPTDFRFSKDSYVRKSIPEFNQLNQKMGTPSHIEYLKMSDKDTRRHRARCVEYDNKKNVCMCVKSPYFTIHCGGASQCKYYSEDNKIENNTSSSTLVTTTESSKQEKEEIYVVSAQVQKNRKCTNCKSKTNRQILDILYQNGENCIKNKLGVYVCARCGRKHLVETLYKTYTSKKNIENISVKFIKCVDDNNES